MNISSFITKVETSVLPVGNVSVRGVAYCIASCSHSASKQLANDHIAPVSNMADTVNPCVLIRK